MSIDTALVGISSVLAITGVGSLWGAVRIIKEWGKSEADRTNAITAINESIKEIKHTLGNGGYSGIKQDVQKIQVHCAEEMADVKARIENLENYR